MSSCRLSLHCLLAFAACVAPSPPAVPDLSRPPPPPPAPAPPPLPPKAEVEISGVVKLPAKLPAKSVVKVFLSDAACGSPGAHSFAEIPVDPTGHWSTEIFVPQGTQIWPCGALVPAKGTITQWGAAKNAPFLGRGAGEVIFYNLEIELQKGAPFDVPSHLDAAP